MVAPRVRITSQLAHQIQAAGLDQEALIEDFQDWRSGRPDDHYLFGLDALGRGSKYLYHVHLVPLNDRPTLADWDARWRFRKGRRTSDRYLFYADGGQREGFLLIALIDDPGAHAIWRSRRAVLTLEQVAEQFCVFGVAP